MKKRTITSAAMVLLLLCGLFARSDDSTSSGFSPWLTDAPFQAWLKENVEGKPLSLTTVEARIQNGVHEWRVHPVPAPPDVELHWYWSFGMDQKSYHDRIADLVVKQGYQQVWVQSFPNEKGEKSFQAIFLKTEKKYDFSPWLADAPLQVWLKENMEGKHLYANALEGRLNNGVTEWRVRLAPAPTHVEWYWYWWFGMDEKFYQARVDGLVTKQGFEQIWVQSFLNEKGEKAYQAIFLKIVKKPSP